MAMLESATVLARMSSGVREKTCACGEAERDADGECECE